MVRHSLILCSLALASCAMNPSTGGRAAGLHTERPIAGSPRLHCDRIRVICIDANVPGAPIPSMSLPMLTVPALPNVLTLSR